MNFSDKFNFLMNITGTKNSSIAKQLSLDPSYISRIRRGERSFAKNADYVKNIAEYFARRFRNGENIKMLSDLTGRSRELLLHSGQREDAIAYWLVGHPDDNSEKIDGFLSAVSGMGRKAVMQRRKTDASLSVRDEGSCIMTGSEGMRKAVLLFLEKVLESNEASSVLLFSDEPMDWLTENKEFEKKWKSMMMELARKGNRIKIIHSLGRNLDEMLMGIAEWMPLHMTGTIEPYYYPRKKDGIFRHTLFVAPGISAVFSRSVKGMDGDKAVFHIKNQAGINALENEFYSYLRLCKPLMKIFVSSDAKEYLKLIEEFEGESSQGIMKNASLSVSTMPRDVGVDLLRRLKIPDAEKLIDHLDKRRESFLQNIDKKRFVEIIRLPHEESIMKEEIEVGLSGLFNQGPMRYSRKEVKAHLENMVKLMEKHEMYEVFIDDGEDRGMLVYAKESVGVVVAKLHEPVIMFAINESNMTAAFWDYMEAEAEKFKMQKKRAIKRIRELIEKI